jgi:hypothetical protein
LPGRQAAALRRGAARLLWLRRASSCVASWPAGELLPAGGLLLSWGVDSSLGPSVLAPVTSKGRRDPGLPPFPLQTSCC